MLAAFLFTEAAMLRRIAVVGVPAYDVYRATHFYHDVLDLGTLPHYIGPPHFQVGDTFLAIFKCDTSVAQSAVPLAAFEVDDLEAAMAELSARGVRFDGNAHEECEARWVSFHDSEGNRLELIQFVSIVS
jgi:predicted enzyme related to lactoylglutathione lyase